MPCGAEEGDCCTGRSTVANKESFSFLVQALLACQVSKPCLRQPVLPSPRLPCSSQCSALNQRLQVAASRRLRNAGEFAVDGIGNRAMLPNVLHRLLHTLFLLEQQGLIGGDILLPRLGIPQRPSTGRGWA